MGTGKHPVRSCEPAAGPRLPNGDALHPGVEDATGHRVPQIQGHDAGTSEPEGCGRQVHHAGVLGLARRLLPLRQEPADGRSTSTQGCHAAGDQSRSSIGHSSGRPGPEESGVASGEGPEGDGATNVRATGWDDTEPGRVRQVEEPTSRCFLDKSRVCASDCKAYAVSQREPCRLLSALDKLMQRTSPRPVAPPPPKVT